MRNEALHNLYSSLNTIRTIKLKATRWSGYEERIGERGSTYKILVGKPSQHRRAEANSSIISLTKSAITDICNTAFPRVIFQYVLIHVSAIRTHPFTCASEKRLDLDLTLFIKPLDSQGDR
jgi:hypothetical protein